jgi:uncharacterized membrane protein
MPFCTQCGHQVTGTDVFCAQCGQRQSSAFRAPQPPPGPAPDPLAGITPRTAAILCYVPTVGWIAAVVVLAARKFRNDRIVRFHAFQGLYLFAAWLVVQWVIRPLMLGLPDRAISLYHILEGLLLAVSILMMVKASHDEPYVLPIIGELAQKSAAEQ